MQPSSNHSAKRPRSRTVSKGKCVFEASFPSKVEAVEPTVHQLLRAMEENGCRDGILNDVEIAVREALHNAVLHGNEGNPRKRVRVECSQQPDHSFLLVVRDSGPGFDPDRVADPTKSENLFRETGRGIYMIRHFMDEVQFKRGGREIRMLKKR
jgi:serine/threonine-protein kinase RsbW